MRRSLCRLQPLLRSSRPLANLRTTPRHLHLAAARPFHTSFAAFAAHTSPPAPAHERQRSDKVWASADEAVADLTSGSLVLSAGFGLCGTAETLITAIAKRADLRDLTAVSNNAGNSGDGGLGEQH